MRSSTKSLAVRAGAGLVLSLALVSLEAKQAPAAGAELEVRLKCDSMSVPGRVRCALSLSAPKGFRLSWVDALVVSTPQFARPLRSRVPQRKLSGKDSQAEVLLALLASSTGRGTVTVRGRAVVCSLDEASACRPASGDASAELSIGP